MTFSKVNYGKNHFAKIILLLGLFVHSSCSKSYAQLDTSSYTKQDTILPSKKNYQGYRLKITNVKVLKKKGNQRKISCTLINTGREKVRTPHASSAPNIVVNYDKSLAENGLTAYTNSIERALLKKKFTLDAGKISNNYELKFNLSKEVLAKNEATENKASKDKSTNHSTQTISSKDIYDPSLCGDLQVDTFFVLKRSKKTVELGFKITNYGKGPAAMFGETAATEDNIAIRAYASGTPKLSRGDLVLGGAFIEGGMEDKNGVLMPNESFSGSFVVATKKKTRYMPYFIIAIDVYQGLWECDETNNVKPLLDRK